MFVCIQNPGVAPVEGYTLLGASTTRGCDVDGTIGQFGSGNKHAINVLLRAGLKVFVYCGKTRLDFYTRDDEIDDGLVRKPIKRVMCKLGGTSTRTLDLGWVLDFGAIDWTDLGMALREFISNAIDRTLREENGQFVPAIQDGRLSVCTVDDSQVRAKDGFTRVYVEVNDDVTRYVSELPKRFLHFSEKPEQVTRSMLPKEDRNLSERRTPMIYRAGVLVREIRETSAASVYDYNFKVDELKIDECRNSSEYEIKAAVARLYRRANAEELTPVFRALVDGEEPYEAGLESYYLKPYSWEAPKPEHTKQWQAAWEAVAGDAVLCGPSAVVATMVENKGHVAKPIPSRSFAEAAEVYGIRTDLKVLTASEREGRQTLPATDAAVAAVDQAWTWLEKTNLCNGKQKPPVGCFRDVMDAGKRRLGFADETGVYLADDHATAVTKAVLKTALEECVHWVTQATDGSRDFQDLVLRMVVELAV